MSIGPPVTSKTPRRPPLAWRGVTS
jgi:hypothetical protein